MLGSPLRVSSFYCEGRLPRKMRAKPRVLVVGGGLGGLALANGLRARGFDFVVLERSARQQGYQLGLQPHGTEALRALGVDVATLERELLARPDCLLSVRVASARGKGVAELLSFATGKGGGVIDRARLHAMLLEPVAGAWRGPCPRAH